MTDTALDRARRELEDAISRAIGMIRCDSSAPVAGVDAAIARLEAAARREGWRTAIELAMGSEDVKKALDAARLAGRLEQAEWTCERFGTLGPPSGVEGGDESSCCDHVASAFVEITTKERDRLRAELEADGPSKPESSK